jgi:septum formation protein
MKIVLASASPRRKELLKGLDIDFEVRTKGDIDESFPTDMPVAEAPLYIALQKAKAYIDEIDDDETVITADTVVILDNELIGKPCDRAAAIAMLRRLSGRRHEVVTGVALTGKAQQTSFSVSSYVVFDELTEDEIVRYVDKYKPFDKAGAYGIQEWIGFVGVRSVEGSFYNIMGLPVQRLYRELLRLDSQFLKY